MTAKFRDTSMKATRKSSDKKKKTKTQKSSRVKLDQSMIEVANFSERQPLSTKTSFKGATHKKNSGSSNNSSAVKLTKRDSLH